METFSALLAICAGNSPVTGEFPAQRPVTRSFDVSLICVLNKRSSNNREAGDLRCQPAHYDVFSELLAVTTVDRCMNSPQKEPVIRAFVFSLNADPLKKSPCFKITWRSAPPNTRYNTSQSWEFHIFAKDSHVVISRDMKSGTHSPNMGEMCTKFEVDPLQSTRDATARTRFHLQTDMVKPVNTPFNFVEQGYDNKRIKLQQCIL